MTAPVKPKRSILSLIHEWSLILLAIAFVVVFCSIAIFLFETDLSGCLFSAYRVGGVLVYFVGIGIGSIVILCLPDESSQWMIAIGRISLKIALIGVYITAILILVYLVVGLFIL